MRRAGYGALVLLLAAILLPASPATALVRHGSVEIDGSLRTIGALLDNFDFEPFFGGDEVDGLSQTLFRVTLLAEPRPWIAFEVHPVQSFDVASTGGGGDSGQPFGLVAGETRYRALDATAEWLEERNRSATLWLDRGNVKIRAGSFDLTVGRQAVSFGKAFFWNPLDVFLPFDPRQFDQEYKPGVDAARLDVALDRFSGLTAVAAAGSTLDAFGRARSDDDLDATWFGSAVVGRGFTTWEGFDLALQGGKVYGGYHAGGGVTGEVGLLETRLEIANHFASGSPPLLPGVFPAGERLVEDAFTAVVGVGRFFPSTLRLEAEYFRNGAGDSDSLDAALLRFASGGSLDLGENLLGLLASYDLLPIVTGTLAAIVNLDDPSGQLQPRLAWSAGDEIEVLGGGIVSFGERPRGTSALRPELQSEFGAFPDVWYGEVKVYF